MAIAKKCAVCGKLYVPYNHVDIQETNEDFTALPITDENNNVIYRDVSNVYTTFEYLPNAFEYITLKKDMDVQNRSAVQDICQECLTAINNFIEDDDSRSITETGNPVLITQANASKPYKVMADISRIKASASSFSVTVYTGKNFLEPPYYEEKEYEEAGIHYIWNDDGSIILNGTTTNTASYFYLKDFRYSDLTNFFSYKNIRVPSGKQIITYTAPGQPFYTGTNGRTDDRCSLRSVFIELGTSTKKYVWSGELAINATNSSANIETNGFYSSYLRLISSGLGDVTFDNFILRPALMYNEQSTTYTTQISSDSPDEIELDIPISNGANYFRTTADVDISVQYIKSVYPKGIAYRPEAPTE